MAIQVSEENFIDCEEVGRQSGREIILYTSLLASQEMGHEVLVCLDWAAAIK